MKKHRPSQAMAFVIAAVLLCISASCSMNPQGKLTIVHVSDIHYFSPTLIEDDDFMWSVTMQSDGKDTVQSSLIARAFVDDMIKLKPNAVVVTGDLTLNGETASHEELRGLLSTLKDNGIDVYVMTGNHDVNMTAYRYTLDGIEETPSFGSQMFEDHWWDFGYGNALSQDRWSNSYIAELNDKTWLLSVDSNTGSKGTIRKSTLQWIEDNLKEAQANGIRVVSATHQNLFVHNDSFTWGYQLNNAEALMELYERYGVEVNLSGHLHVQTIVEHSGIADIAVSSLVDYPLQYGVLTIDGDKMSYRTKEVSDLELRDKARQVFDACTEHKALSELENGLGDGLEGGTNGEPGGKTEESIRKMIDAALQINREYFLGKLSKVDKEAVDLWRQSDGFFGRYLVSIYDADGSWKDNRRWHN